MKIAECLSADEIRVVGECIDVVLSGTTETTVGAFGGTTGGEVQCVSASRKRLCGFPGGAGFGAAPRGRVRAAAASC